MPLSQLDIDRIAEAVSKKVKGERSKRFLRGPKAAEMLGVKMSYFYELIKRDDFPPPFTLPDSSVKVWLEGDIEDWALSTYGRKRR